MEKQIELIGENVFGSYHYNGASYSVMIASPFGDEYATKAKLSFLEAKGLFEAMEFYKSNDLPKPSEVTVVIKAGRKEKFTTADEWMIYFGKAFEWSKIAKRGKKGYLSVSGNAYTEAQAKEYYEDRFQPAIDAGLLARVVFSQDMDVIGKW